MSDYFGALMRSSGMPIGGRAHAISQLRTAEPDVVERDVERSAPVLRERSVQAASNAQQGVAPVSVAHPIDHPAALAPIGRAVPEPPAVQTGHVHTPQARHPAGADAPAVEAPRPALGQALARAAMQWVAADPQPDHTREVEPVGRPPIATPAEPAASVRSTPRESVPAYELPIRPAGLSPARLPAPVAPPDRGEAVEISIGAIHVRVDAPNAQTVARPSVTLPAPVARAAAATTNPRSALSRRALRRI